MNEQQFLYRAIIPQVTDSAPRPIWSVMIPAYNCAHTLRQTLESVLAQDPGPDKMQIEVVDDCSTKDDPEAVVKELGCGRVDFFRQPKNVGHTRNFNTCLERSRGRLVHLLHGDDCVRDGFYRTMQRAFEKNPQIGAAFCRDIRMDEHGHWESFSPLLQKKSGILSGWLETIAVGQRLQTPAMVVKREVYERLGGFDQRISHWGEDWEMWTRIAVDYPVWYEVEPLAVYRIHSSSLTNHNFYTGDNINDFLRANAIIQSYFPEEKASEISQKAREACALSALRKARRMLDAGDRQAPLVQMRQVLKCSRSRNVLAQTALLLLVMIAKPWQGDANG